MNSYKIKQNIKSITNPDTNWNVAMNYLSNNHLNISSEKKVLADSEAIKLNNHKEKII